MGSYKIKCKTIKNNAHVGNREVHVGYHGVNVSLKKKKYKTVVCITVTGVF